MLNHITVMGRLTRDVELKYIPSNVAVANFTVAVDRDYNQGEEKQTDFIDCVAWRHTAEFLSKYFAKGSMAVVSGRLQVRNYEDKDGNKRKAVEIVAESVYFGESKRTAPTGETADSGLQSASQARPAFVDVQVEDGDLPF